MPARFVQFSGNRVVDVMAPAQYPRFQFLTNPATGFGGGFDVDYIRILVPGADHRRESQAGAFWSWLQGRVVAFETLTGAERQAAIDAKFATDGNVAEKQELEGG